MSKHDGSSNEDLDDTALLQRELDQRNSFERIEAAEPRFRDTTYGMVPGAPALVESWERWWKTNLAARVRGILNRTSDR